MPELVLLQDLAIVMAVSAAMVILSGRLHVPVVLGYILAGIVIGPHTPPFPLVTDLHSIHTLSELGVIFLLFSIGLEFSFTKLLKVGAVSVIAATVEILLMIWIGFAAGRAFGWSTMDSLFLGAILSISSTTIIAKVLFELKKLHEPFAQVILGILIVEDLLAIALIAILSGLAWTGTLTLGAAGIAMLRVGAFVLAVLCVGLFAVPRLLRYLERSKTPEMMVITVLGLCFGTSVLGVRLGFSAALGAFLIGAIIAETKQAHGIIQRMEPMRDMFTAIFFVAVGMLIEPRLLAQYWLPIVLITGVTIVGKVASCSLATFLTGYSAATSLQVGLGLAQIGEFSFIIARLGQTTGVTSAFLYPIAVSVSGITAFSTPFLMRQTPQIVAVAKRLTPEPLETFAMLYRSWLERIQLSLTGSERKAAIWQGLRRHLPWLLVYAVGGMALAWGSVQARHWFIELDRTLYFSVVGLGLLFIFIGFAYTADRLLWNVILAPLLKPAEHEARLLHQTLRFLLLLCCGAVYLALLAMVGPAIPLVIAVLGLMAASALTLGSSIWRVHQQIERVVVSIFDREQPLSEVQETAAHDELVDLIREEYAGDVETEDFLLPSEESAVNRTIRELRLRTETGASIVAIYREHEFIPNPSPDTTLLPGSVLLLMGRKEQIKKAFDFLQQQIKKPAHGP